MCTGYAKRLHGVCLGCAWDVHGVCMECAKEKHLGLDLGPNMMWRCILVLMRKTILGWESS